MLGNCSLLWLCPPKEIAENLACNIWYHKKKRVWWNHHRIYLEFSTLILNIFSHKKASCLEHWMSLRILKFDLSLKMLGKWPVPCINPVSTWIFLLCSLFARWDPKESNNPIYSLQLISSHCSNLKVFKSVLVTSSQQTWQLTRYSRFVACP